MTRLPEIIAYTLKSGKRPLCRNGTDYGTTLRPNTPVAQFDTTGFRREISMTDSKKNKYAHENVLLVAPFLLLLATNVWFHAPWGDELHAWGLILASSDIGDLFRRLHYEGHPGLWHLLLWWAAAVSMDPATLAAVHLAVASGILLLVAFHPYFSRVEKVLLLSNYFLVFD